MTDDVEPTTPPPTGGAPTAAPGAEDATEVDALRRLGLDVLLGDEEGGGARWSDVEDRAHRAGRRRSWIAAVAAAVVLVLAVGAGALLARAGRESSTPAGPGGERMYVLPPEDAAIVAAYVNPTRSESTDLDAFLTGPDLSGYVVDWTAASGNRVRLVVHRPNGILPPPTTVDTVPRDRAELQAFVDVMVGSDPVELTHHPIDGADEGVLDPAIFTCIGNPPDEATPWVFGVAATSWIAYLGSDAERAPCGPGADSGTQHDVLSANRELRLVDEDEWRTFMSRWIAATPTVTTATPTSTTVDPAVSDYCGAIERFRGSGLIDSTTGNVRVEALPLVEEMRDAAPEEIRPAFDTMVSWLETGAPTPKPSEVAVAEGDMTRDWIARCQGGSP
jgi:hypothetical protein